MPRGQEYAALVIERALLRFNPVGPAVLDLRDVSLSWTGLATLQGPSGSGKTTFFRMLVGWYADMASGGHCDLATDFDSFRDIRLVGGHASLLPWRTVSSNFSLQVGPLETRALTKALEDVCLDPEILTLYPHQLSLGMYKRVELAIAVLQDTPLLLLDEFFSSLDPQAKGASNAFIRKHRAEKMTLVSVHEEDLRDWIGGKGFYFDRCPSDGTVIGVREK